MPADTEHDDQHTPDFQPRNSHDGERGKLTVFLGAATGVGKTYTMLEAALARKNAGADVVIGWVETHGRKETERLATGLERVAPKELWYGASQLFDMDTDAVLQRNPEIVLIDELSHVNSPRARHLRRFQDVEEILQAGINVYTTLNIQHLESLNDVVAQITGVMVKETVPDYVLEQADSVQLVDIPPEDLIQRLREGKLNIPGEGELSQAKFFRPGNINALRELALRYTARQVDKYLGDYMRQNQIDGPWPAAGRVMVCVSASPFSAQLIRVAHRLSAGFQSDWLAVHIGETRRTPANLEETGRVARNMKLAEELGAKTIHVHGANLVEEILQVARANNVTAIVIGKPRHSMMSEFFCGSVVERLIRQSGGINVYVIQANKDNEPSPSIAKGPEAAATNAKAWEWRQYCCSLLMVAAVTVLGLLLEEHIEIVNVALLYQLPVTMSAFWWGRWPSYFTAVASVLSFDFLFIPPVFTFSVHDIAYFWSFITFLIVAFVIGGRTELLRNEAAIARQRERATSALYKFSREIAAVVDMETIVRELAVQAATTLGRKVIVLLPDEDGKLILWAEQEPGNGWPEGSTDRGPLIDSNEAATVAWVFEHRQAAGRASDTLTEGQYLYLPLVTREDIVGVLGLHVVEKVISPDQRRLMEAWAGLAAIAIQRVRLAEKAREAAFLRESERLHTALFNSISHELRTPLASIVGSVSTLLEAENVYSAKDRRELMENIRDGAARMDRLVANLLDTARLESGMMRLKSDWCDVEDVIGTALRRMTTAIQDRPLTVNILSPLPLVRGDCVLLEQVLINLVDNAVKYSSADGPVDITAIGEEKDCVTVSVSDRGIGIPSEDIQRVFDKFYRVQYKEMRASGTGLGLAICKGIIEAHGGKIWAEPRVGGGTTIVFTLPAQPHDESR